MKILVCITFILGSFLTLYAQGEAGISGKVSDVKGQPVSYANITLQRVDSTFVTGCTSDEKGKFVISKLEGQLLASNLFCGLHHPSNQTG